MRDFNAYTTSYEQYNFTVISQQNKFNFKCSQGFFIQANAI
jgi:hypothetical protein